MTDEEFEVFSKLEQEELEREAMNLNAAVTCSTKTISLLKNTMLQSTRCSDCNVHIQDQFLDCACVDRHWKKCTICFHAFEVCNMKGKCKDKPFCRCCCSCSLPDVEFPVEHAVDDFEDDNTVQTTTPEENKI